MSRSGKIRIAAFLGLWFAFAAVFVITGESVLTILLFVALAGSLAWGLN